LIRTSDAAPGRAGLPAWLELAAVAAAGALQTLACAHTAAWPLPLVAIALLAWCVHGATPRRAALLGWAFGTAWLGAATWWLFISMHRYGGLPAPLAVAAVALLSAALSLYLGAAMAWVAALAMNGCSQSKAGRRRWMRRCARRC
jgi:apolipoprotein N-acyltransferase